MKAIQQRRKWSQADDQTLLNAIKVNGPHHWNEIAGRYLPSRTGKQCRERWLLKLSPEIVQKDWSDNDDQHLLDLQRQYGNKWATIAKFLPGRSPTAIKNRWHCLIRRTTKAPSESSQNNMINSSDDELTTRPVQLSYTSNSYPQQSTEGCPKLIPQANCVKLLFPPMISQIPENKNVYFQNPIPGIFSSINIPITWQVNPGFEPYYIINTTTKPVLVH